VIVNKVRKMHVSCSCCNWSRDLEIYEFKRKIQEKRKWVKYILGGYADSSNMI
jgi:hypothetical protein